MKVFTGLTDAGLILVPLGPKHLEFVRKWRNESRHQFFDSNLIEAEDELIWFWCQYMSDLSDRMWIARTDELGWVGTGALVHIDLEKREAEWGRLMVDSSVRGKGMAGRISRLVRDYALDVLNLNRIYGSLYTNNDQVLRIDIAAGYIPYREENGVTYVELWRKDHRTT